MNKLKKLIFLIKNNKNTMHLRIGNSFGKHFKNLKY